MCANLRQYIIYIYGAGEGTKMPRPLILHITSLVSLNTELKQ